MKDFFVVAQCHDLIGEVPIYCDRTNSLWWIDILRPAIHRLTLADNRIQTWNPSGGRLGSFALRDSSGLLLATSAGLQYFDPETARQEPYPTEFLLPTGTIFNDGRCDRQGRFWVGTMRETFEPKGELFRVDPNGVVTSWLSEIIVPNGIAFSTDNRRMYFADTRRLTMSYFDFEATSGSISNRRYFSDTRNRNGRPDGSCVDSEGCIWNAEYAGGRITRYAPDGTIDRVLETPVSHPTSICFGGPELDIMFITSGSYALSPAQAKGERLAGSVLGFRPGVRGIVEPRFKG
jgi:sugar lactone lactonase YvrE